MRLRATTKRLAALGCLVALALDGSACAEAPRGRVLLVGIDGAGVHVMRPLMEEGRLPNLARIARDGVVGPLQSFLPLHSPRIWATIATGKVPEKHGILTFAYTDDAGQRRLYDSRDRKVHAIWNIASNAGLEVGVVNYWNTYPPEIIEGVSPFGGSGLGYLHSMRHSLSLGSEIRRRRRANSKRREAGRSQLDNQRQKRILLPTTTRLRRRSAFGSCEDPFLASQ